MQMSKIRNTKQQTINKRQQKRHAPPAILLLNPGILFGFQETARAPWVGLIKIRNRKPTHDHPQKSQQQTQTPPKPIKKEKPRKKVSRRKPTQLTHQNQRSGCGSKLNHQESAGSSPCFRLSGFHLGYQFFRFSFLKCRFQESLIDSWPQPSARSCAPERTRRACFSARTPSTSPSPRGSSAGAGPPIP